MPLHEAWSIILSEEENTKENRKANSCICFQCNRKATYNGKLDRVIYHLNNCVPFIRKLHEFGNPPDWCTPLVNVNHQY